MSVDPKIPPAGEEIHLPGLSAQPLLVAVGTTIILIGVTFHVAVLIFGIVLTAWTIGAWIRDTRREINELPIHAEHH